MTPEQWEKVKELLQAAIQVAPNEREHFLDENCDVPQLRDEVESLLVGENQHTQELFSLQESLAVADEIQEAYAWVGRRLGAYKILEKIGEGGMGTVYRAIRADQQFEKDVAIKIAKQGLDNPLALTRFRAERQILAGLDHPNIARLIDAGTTESGSPYFVMELVAGRPIDEYCKDQNLSLDEKLLLFTRVCRAVQYAHQHLVVHRDLKPGNILVSKDGVPKLLDFGIAKILDPNLFHGIALENTLSFMRVLTPEYASPEQISGSTVTTASDVYSLGVILFLLLTGSSPYGSTCSPESLSEAICHTEPPRPSRILRKLQNQGSVDMKQLKALTHRLEGDLDNIVSTALRKEPERRYQSVEQFAEDIRRHLEHLPVLAHKSTVVYRCRKYVLRHKVGVAAAALVLLSLLAGIVVTTREARIARVNELRAERRFNDVRKLANSLMFEINDSISQSGATAGRKLILQRAQEYLDSLAQESNADPALLRELATAYTRMGDVFGNPRDANVGNLEESLRNYRRAVELREAIVNLSPSDVESRRELAESYMSLALALQQKKQGNNQGDFLSKALSILETLIAADPANPKIEFDVALAWERRGQQLGADRKWAEARAEYRKSLEIFERLATEDPESNLYMTGVASEHKLVGGTLIQEKQFQSALNEYRAALAVEQKGIEAEPQNARKRYDITMTYSDIGFILGKQKDVDGALDAYHKVLDMRKELGTNDPTDTRVRRGIAMTYNYIARLLWLKSDFEEALKDEKQAFAIRQALWRGDPTNLINRRDLAFAEGSIGETYVKMAFQARSTSQRKLAFCRQAETWLQKALPELPQVKDLLGGDIDYPAMLQQAADRCRAAIAGSDRQSRSPDPARP